MRLIPALLVAAAVALPATAAAQKLAPGKWTGTIAPPDNAAIEATFDVQMAGDTTKITINAMGQTMGTTDVKVENDRVLFTFAPGGTAVRCTLLTQPDKSYSGDCLDSQGGKGVIVIRPPKA